MKDETIEKYIWTEDDFDAMGWHDATLYAVGFLPEKYQLMLDIDYIFKWVEPDKGGTFYKFVVSPATLIFQNVHGLSVSISEPFRPIQIQSIDRMSPKQPPNADYTDRDKEWHWVIDLEIGTIELDSIGFTQIIRKTPVLNEAQSLELEIRGGISFADSRQTNRKNG